MPINPIEFQGSIPRTQDVAQQKYHENMKPQNDQMNFQTQLDRNISNKHQQVSKQDNADKKDDILHQYIPFHQLPAKFLPAFR